MHGHGLHSLSHSYSSILDYLLNSSTTKWSSLHLGVHGADVLNAEMNSSGIRHAPHHAADSQKVPRYASSSSGS